MSTTSWQKSAALADKIALELVFATAGKDDGLLPINSLLGEIEDARRESPFPERLEGAISMARKWLDAALEQGSLSASFLSRLSAWTAWMQAAAQADAGGRAVPDDPAAFTASEEPTAAMPPAETESQETQ